MTLTVPTGTERAAAVLRAAGPFLAAYAAIRLEPALTALAASRPGVLPVAMCAMVFGLLIHRVRNFLIITLCFGIAQLAYRDMLHGRVPAQIDYVIVERLYPAGWGLLALLALGAGIAESIRPGSVYARRCYFAAAAVYLLGHGAMQWMVGHIADGLVLTITGIFAGVGVVVAPRIIRAEADFAPEDEDIRALREADDRRAKALAGREWQDRREEVGGKA
jgi:hypothetical protein